MLFGAEKMLVAMGYQPVPGREAEVLSLAPAAVGQHPVNIDMVTSVARDCLLAGVECRLLADVHAAVSAQFPTTTAEEVIEFRRDHIGSTEVCSRELLYRKQQLAALPSPQYGLQSYGFPGPAAPVPGYQPPPQQTNGYTPVSYPPAPPGNNTNPDDLNTTEADLVYIISRSGVRLP